MADFDVVVLGSGFAGLAAAVSAAQSGASVLVAEAEDVIGGSSRFSGGMMSGVGTRQQKLAGVEDTPEEFFRDYMTTNQWNVDSGPVQRMASDSGAAIEWLEGIGVEFLDEIYYSGDELRPRCHVPAQGGAGIIESLHRRCREFGNIEFALGRRVDRLLTEDHRVIGVAVGDDHLTAHAVVLATGGFGANAELLESLCPSTTISADRRWYVGADGARGDAIGLGRSVGADIVGSERLLATAVPNIGRLVVIYYPGWMIFVNKAGKRFCNETHPYPTMTLLFEAQGGVGYAVFDETAKTAARAHDAGQTQKAELPTDVIDHVFDSDSIDGFVRDGAFVKADTLAELADKLGVDPANLQDSADVYNEHARSGSDPFFLKDPAVVRPIETAPFYGAELRMGQVAVTKIGPRIDADARVLTPGTRPIPGLYAAGECTGGVIGDAYVGTGNSVVNCIVFGRVAGTNAAAWAKRHRMD